MDESPANPVLAGALVGGLYSGAQTAINGGSFSEVLKAAAIGAVTGAIGGAIGGPLGEVAGAVVHAAAHGVVGGLTSMAMGGTFQDGFIGSAIGAGVTSALGAMPGMSALEGRGVLKVIGRTAVAAISGGAASVLAGGKFADGAYSAAFFHLFNSEAHRSENWEFRDPEGPFATVGDDPSHWMELSAQQQEAFALAKTQYQGSEFVFVAFDENYTFAANASGYYGAYGQLGSAVWVNAEGQDVTSWTVVSGGVTKRPILSGQNNRIPNGDWNAKAKMSAISHNISDPFTRHGFSFKYDIPTPGLNPGRGNIMFHPTSGITEGCIEFSLLCRNHFPRRLTAGMP